MDVIIINNMVVVRIYHPGVGKRKRKQTKNPKTKNKNKIIFNLAEILEIWIDFLHMYMYVCVYKYWNTNYESI